MPPLSDDLAPASVLRLQSLDLIARTLVRGFLKGLHGGKDAGASSDFRAYRAYAQGDEIRHFDWRTFARTDRFYVKEYQDETNLRACLVVDCSASMGFASREVSKYRYAICLAAAIGHLLLSQKDAVALALADRKLRFFLPPRATAQHFAGLLQVLEQTTPKRPTDLPEALAQLAARAHQAALVLLFSDCLDDPGRIVAGLQRLRSRGAEVLLFHIVDPAERTFPFSDWVVFRDSEHPGDERRMDARGVRELYLKNVRQHLDILRRGCRAAAIDHVLLDTDTPFDRGLAAYLDSRARHRRPSGRGSW